MAVRGRRETLVETFTVTRQLLHTARVTSFVETAAEVEETAAYIRSLSKWAARLREASSVLLLDQKRLGELYTKVCSDIVEKRKRKRPGRTLPSLDILKLHEQVGTASTKLGKAEEHWSKAESLRADAGGQEAAIATAKKLSKRAMASLKEFTDVLSLTNMALRDLISETPMDTPASAPTATASSSSINERAPKKKGKSGKSVKLPVSEAIIIDILKGLAYDDSFKRGSFHFAVNSFGQALAQAEAGDLQGSLSTVNLTLDLAAALHLQHNKSKETMFLLGLLCELKADVILPLGRPALDELSQADTFFDQAFRMFDPELWDASFRWIRNATRLIEMEWDKADAVKRDELEEKDRILAPHCHTLRPKGGGRPEMMEIEEIYGKLCMRLASQSLRRKEFQEVMKNASICQHCRASDLLPSFVDNPLRCAADRAEPKDMHGRALWGLGKHSSAFTDMQEAAAVMQAGLDSDSGRPDSALRRVLEGRLQSVRAQLQDWLRELETRPTPEVETAVTSKKKSKKNKTKKAGASAPVAGPSSVKVAVRRSTRQESMSESAMVAELRGAPVTEPAVREEWTAAVDTYARVLFKYEKGIRPSDGENIAATTIAIRRAITKSIPDARSGPRTFLQALTMELDAKAQHDLGTHPDDARLSRYNAAMSFNAAVMLSGNNMVKYGLISFLCWLLESGGPLPELRFVIASGTSEQAKKEALYAHTVKLCHELKAANFLDAGAGMNLLLYELFRRWACSIIDYGKAKEDAKENINIAAHAVQVAKEMAQGSNAAADRLRVIRSNVLLGRMEHYCGRTGSGYARIFGQVTGLPDIANLLRTRAEQADYAACVDEVYDAYKKEIGVAAVLAEDDAKR